MITPINERHAWWAVRLREYAERGLRYTRADLTDAIERCFAYIAELELELASWQDIDWPDADVDDYESDVIHAKTIVVKAEFL